MAEEKRRLRPVTGRKRVTKRELDKGGIEHHLGWNAATDAALNKLGWPSGDYSECKIEYFAKIHVVNPGTITEYGVRISPPGG